MPLKPLYFYKLILYFLFLHLRSSQPLIIAHLASLGHLTFIPFTNGVIISFGGLNRHFRLDNYTVRHIDIGVLIV